MGLEHFSMHPNALLEIKKIINETDLNELPDNVLSLFDMGQSVDAEAFLEKINEVST
jgi:phosphotransferase system enzyme I (PtsI)